MTEKPSASAGAPPSGAASGPVLNAADDVGGAADLAQAEGSSGSRRGPRWRQKASALFALTKPRVIELLLVTTLPTMIFAQRGFPDFWLVLATMVGGAFAAGSAGAFNCYIDRDMDRLMNRTKRRPLVTGEVSPREALVFATALGIAALAVLWFGANPLAAALGAAAMFFYVVIYTMILKRRTEQNIIWGGLAGCFPVLIAWAAVRETVEWPAVVLFFIIFLWTPPHYWPLSMKYRTDYQTASVPMLGAVATAKTVSVQVVLYAWATVVCSLLLIPMGWAGITYTAFAVVSGAWFLYESHVLHRQAQEDTLTDKKAMRVFHLSIMYLTLLFVGLAIDPFIGPALMA
ncbi:heme o synthase [Nesterenkonia aerolata]|uniref:Protoheme IX farnesyltransferase n=1 Tax=Nesterenkonia aerolata TaxID=3074079 RepID=A0ABU2DRP8_9MICC|nr:heme o synthase [Nesterenkonia sp. LY-0111]MDR8019174.1 heme o synthase [Nesterenkonia sp. LY-0111]